MKKYKTFQVINLNEGFVSLNDDQSRRRLHNLKVINKESGIFEIKQSIQFKANEVFGYKGVMNDKDFMRIGALPFGDDETLSDNDDDKITDVVNTDDNQPDNGEGTEEHVIEDIDEIIALLTDAILELDTEDDNDYTKGGLPEIGRLEEITGFNNVTAEMRNIAFENFKQLHVES